MINQPINNNAKIDEVDPDDWKQIKCPAVPKPDLGTYSQAYSEAYP